ncbi:Panacea domain-containing protein [Pseudoxanthomonas beigongshangi]
MSYSPATIANYFLEKASQEGRVLTPMQLLKLVYIAHGWHLGFYKTPLINERVEAWRYGPVIPSLYKKVKRFGSKGVDGPLQTGILPWEHEKEVDGTVQKLLDSVWQGYGHFGGIKLSEMTHMKGSPWWRAWNDLGGMHQSHAPLDDAVIQEFYELKIAAHKDGRTYGEVEPDPDQRRRFESEAQSVAEHA